MKKSPRFYCRTSVVLSPTSLSNRRRSKVHPFAVAHVPTRITRTPMNKNKKLILISMLVAAMLSLVAAHGQRRKMSTPLGAKIRRFAPTPLTADTSKLSLKDRQALAKIIAAAKYFDRFYR